MILIREIDYKAICLGVCSSIGGLYGIALVFSILFYFTAMGEQVLSQSPAILQFVAILLGSTIATRKAGHGGMIHGLIIAMIFAVFYFLCNQLIWSAQLLWLICIQKCSLFLSAGMIGGLIGVGLSG